MWEILILKWFLPLKIQINSKKPGFRYILGSQKMYELILIYNYHSFGKRVKSHSHGSLMLAYEKNRDDGSKIELDSGTQPT
jgi:hypothetical protein